MNHQYKDDPDYRIHREYIAKYLTDQDIRIRMHTLVNRNRQSEVWPHYDAMEYHALRDTLYAVMDILANKENHQWN